MSRSEYAFIGAGKMATAIALGLKKSGIPAEKIHAYDVSPAAAKAFSRTTGVTTSQTMAEALAKADLVILAVKPQYAAAALDEARSCLQGKLLVSIAAGLTIQWLSEHAGTTRIVRVMPNTPALAGEGTSCYAGAPGIAEDDLEAAGAVLKSVGLAQVVSESQLDAVTGLSGSGPAYVMEFILALADGGVYCGLPRALAMEMAIQTVLGTAKMCRESGQSVSDLRDAVISPAGTTARGILALQKAGFKGTVSEAVIAGAERSAELGGKKG